MKKNYSDRVASALDACATRLTDMQADECVRILESARSRQRALNSFLKPLTESAAGVRAWWDSTPKFLYIHVGTKWAIVTGRCLGALDGKIDKNGVELIITDVPWAATSRCVNVEILDRATYYDVIPALNKARKLWE